MSKEINAFKSEKGHIWTSFLILISGTFTLIFSSGNKTKLFFIGLGFIFSILLFYVYLKKNDQIELLLNKIDEE